MYDFNQNFWSVKKWSQVIQNLYSNPDRKIVIIFNVSDFGKR